MMLSMPAVQPTDHAKTPSGRGAAVPLSDPSHETSKRLKSNAVSDPSGSSGSDGPRDLPAVPLPALSRVVAPMVGASDLAFRKLCRRHGATLAYTEMLCARRFVEDAAYRFSLFESQRCMLNDRPLIVQFCGNDASNLAAAAALAVGQHGVDGVDLNLGCPQKRAKEALYGSYLLDTEHWPRVFSCVRAMAAAAAPVPVTCKIRLLPTLQETILFAKGLQAAGCALLAVHGRQRGSVSRRRSGPADLRAVGALKRALAIPVLSNGNVRRAACVRHALVRTQADGVMVAEALLRYPALFAPDAPERPTIEQRRDVALEYLQLAETYPPPTIEYARAHLSCMLGRDGAGARLRYKHSHLPPPVLRAALQVEEHAFLWPMDST
uniref:tRNA-dihydrouridine(16/17) synthase [NAD(P)(+)] n=1 Tax=Chrysotila carterae TaxID=13221 RepID=A0A7S4BXB4_CHRCT